MSFQFVKFGNVEKFKKNLKIFKDLENLKGFDNLKSLKLRKDFKNLKSLVKFIKFVIIRLYLYYFAPPNYEVTSINLNNMPTFIPNCTGIKYCITHSCTSEQSPNKKHNHSSGSRRGCRQELL